MQSRRAASASPPVYDRRRLLRTGVVTAGLAAASGVIGQYLVRRADASESRAAVRIPVPADAAPPPPPGADLHIPGLSSFITPNDRFYRIDTALFVPSVDADSWSLRIHGMVDREITLDYRQLLARPLIERDVTLTCVSNEIGGPYISNARWIGAPLKDLLDEAGVHAGATQIVSRSADGFTVGTPTAVAMDGRDAMLAIAMNGEPLPLAHGFPVRMVVPGLYGYVSATKWIVDIELSTFEAFDAYWIQRGWAQQAPIKTESRIDTPRDRSRVAAGQVAVAGVAWAQHVGVAGVEVRVDDGPWQAADLAQEDTVDTWRQWVLRWDAPAGEHVLSVRATDDAGALQVERPEPPFPDGATGDHTITVTGRMSAHGLDRGRRAGRSARGPWHDARGRRRHGHGRAVRRARLRRRRPVHASGRLAVAGSGAHHGRARHRHVPRARQRVPARRRPRAARPGHATRRVLRRPHRGRGRRGRGLALTFRVRAPRSARSSGSPRRPASSGTTPRGRRR